MYDKDELLKYEFCFECEHVLIKKNKDGRNALFCNKDKVKQFCSEIIPSVECMSIEYD